MKTCNIIDRNKGENNPFYGKYHSEEAKKKMMENHWSKKGKLPWAKGLTKKTDERLRKAGKKESETLKRLYKEGILHSWNKKNIIQRKCLFCDNIFSIGESSGKKYCSLSCFNKSQVKYKIVGRQCHFCNNTFLVKENYPKKFCSSGCLYKWQSENFSGKNNPMFGKNGKSNPMFGRKAWSRGQTKLNNPILKKIGENISKALKGRTFSEEWKKNISLSKKGTKPWIIGKHLSLEVRKKLSIKNKGRKHTEEEKRKMSIFQKNRMKDKTKTPFYGRHHTKEVKEAQRLLRKSIRISTHHTKPEKIFLSFIEEYNLPYKYVGDGKFWIEDINPDFINCNGEKIAIEIFGDYWHKQMKGLKWERTEEGRKYILKKYGWKGIVIWESEIKKLESKKIYELLLERLNNTEG